MSLVALAIFCLLSDASDSLRSATSDPVQEICNMCFFDALTMAGGRCVLSINNDDRKYIFEHPCDLRSRWVGKAYEPQRFGLVGRQYASIGVDHCV